MAKKKKKKEPRVVAVDPVTVLARDLKSTALWMGIAVAVVAILSLLQRTVF